MKSKKAFVQIFFLIFAFAAGLVAFAYFRATSTTPELDFVGQNALLLLIAEQKAFNALNYLHKYANYSIEQTIYDFARNGGYKQSKCGRYYGTNVWADIDKKGNEIVIAECYPSKASLFEDFSAYFDIELKRYASSYLEDYLPANYDYELEDEHGLKIIATARDDIEVAIGEYVEAETGAEEENILEFIPSVGAGRKGIEVNGVASEVMEKYRALCKEFGIEAPGPCTTGRKKCCITSGIRKGVGEKTHGLGIALDIYVGDASEQLKWAEAADRIGFTGIGIYPCYGDSHIHVDLRTKNMRSISGKNSVYHNGKMFFTAIGRKTLPCKGHDFETLSGCSRGVRCSG